MTLVFLLVIFDNYLIKTYQLSCHVLLGVCIKVTTPLSESSIDTSTFLTTLQCHPTRMQSSQDKTKYLVVLLLPLCLVENSATARGNGEKIFLCSFGKELCFKDLIKFWNLIPMRTPTIVIFILQIFLESDGIFFACFLLKIRLKSIGPHKKNRSIGSYHQIPLRWVTEK